MKVESGLEASGERPMKKFSSDDADEEIRERNRLGAVPRSIPRDSEARGKRAAAPGVADRVRLCEASLGFVWMIPEFLETLTRYRRQDSEDKRYLSGQLVLGELLSPVQS